MRSIKHIALKFILISFLITCIFTSNGIIRAYGSSSKFYYSKYSCYYGYLEPTEWAYQDRAQSCHYGSISYYFDNKTGTFGKDNSIYIDPKVLVLYWYSDINDTCSRVYKLVYDSPGSNSSSYDWCSRYYKTNTFNVAQRQYFKDQLIESNIIAQDGTYPDNGRNTDGYWYVKETPIPTSSIMPITPTQNAALFPTYETPERSA